MGIGSVNCACPSTRLVGLIGSDSTQNASKSTHDLLRDLNIEITHIAQLYTLAVEFVT